MKFRDMELVRSILASSIKHYEQLGVCVAIFAGGAAIAKYASWVFSPLPVAAIIVGFLTSVMGIFWPYASYLKLGRISRFLQKYGWGRRIALVPVMIGSIFFVFAGAVATVKQLTS